MEDIKINFGFGLIFVVLTAYAYYFSRVTFRGKGDYVWNIVNFASFFSTVVGAVFGLNDAQYASFREDDFRNDSQIAFLLSDLGILTNFELSKCETAQRLYGYNYLFSQFDDNSSSEIREINIRDLFSIISNDPNQVISKENQDHSCDLADLVYREFEINEVEKLGDDVKKIVEGNDNLSTRFRSLIKQTGVRPYSYRQVALQKLYAIRQRRLPSEDSHHLYQEYDPPFRFIDFVSYLLLATGLGLGLAKAREDIKKAPRSD